MTPQKQRFYHRPEQGVYGDCHRAAYASLLDLPIDDVPHFYEGGASAEEALKRERDFLASRNLVPLSIAFPASLDNVFMTLKYLNPGTPFILGGKSKSDCGHSVVACDGEIIHDPALNNSGIVGPMDDGNYWVTYVGARVTV